MVPHGHMQTTRMAPPTKVRLGSFPLFLILVFSLPLCLATQTPQPEHVRTRPDTLSTSSKHEHRLEQSTHLTRRHHAEGAPCPDEEGQWNCLTTGWQRCAAGHWSPVMDMAEGSACEPSGLTYDIQVLHDGDSGAGETGDHAGSGAATWETIIPGFPGLYFLVLFCGIMGLV
ncbi:hypothetical protein ACRALDRAFT_2058149 [Sodiomyces alcalophilus JCM 7366]|uniref:uncharacterized protein n=1 Tax=Sodiomyces alcalophilus JCM 7366 TaxID=591952 RepID=UPI0039B60B0B